MTMELAVEKEHTTVTGLNWEHIIPRHRGSFIHKDDLEKHSHVFRLLSGADKFDDERGPDDEPDPLALANPLYDAEIDAIRQQFERKETEKQRQDEDIKDLTEKVAKRMAKKQWVANIKSPCPFPRISSWSRGQQRFVVDMLMRYWATGVPANPPPTEAEDVWKLMELVTGMRAEQEEYFQFAKQVNATQLDRYNFIRRQVDRYIQLSMETKMRRAQEIYPLDYHELNMLPLAPPAGQPPCLYATSEPLELGQVPVCVIPSLRTYTDVKRQTEFLELMCPSADVYPRDRQKGFQSRDGTYLYKMPVSADPNVALLSAQQEFDVVTTPSVLKALLDNSAPWDRQWEVPVTVRLVPGTQNGTRRRVVFLDKPLPPRSLTCIERNGRAHKRTARILVCKRVTGPGPVDYTIWEEQGDRRKTQPFKDKISKKKKKKCKQKKKRDLALAAVSEAGQCLNRSRKDSAVSGEGSEPPGTQLDEDEMSVESDDSDDTGLQIDWTEGAEQQEELQGGQTREEAGGVSEETGDVEEERMQTEDEEEDGQEETVGRRGNVKRSRSSESESPSVAASRHPDGGMATTTAAGRSAGPSPPEVDGCTERTSASDSEPEDQETAESSDGSPFLRPPPGLNVHYRVWQLGRLKLLLRATTHGMRDNPNMGLVRYTVHAKPAYQPGLGIEVLTRSEVLSQWLDCLVRPNSRIVRVHLDPISQRVIVAEERSLGQVTEELAKYDTGFKPAYGLQVLESVLRELTPLTPGQYLLSHDSRTGAFVRLCRAGESSVPGVPSVRLSFPPGPAKVLLETPRCLSIDPSILTPYNTRFGRVPATFCFVNGRPGVGESGWKEYWEERGIKRKSKSKRNKAKQQQQNSSAVVPLSPFPGDRGSRGRPGSGRGRGASGRGRGTSGRGRDATP